MDTENPPLVLPNGYVYSTKALEEMAKKNDETAPLSSLDSLAVPGGGAQAPVWTALDIQGQLAEVEVLVSIPGVDIIGKTRAQGIMECCCTCLPTSHHLMLVKYSYKNPELCDMETY
ncbi:hypothetical protein MLD38_009785 [Melastoma candidum]|uniref:Uncharacterized protein n=1 Tax=Melastoma candidum TaxID=119954 RepID=A0ACB9RYB0_9MYRT|nr:hypothetical protein MLD38_009785 [Melastoma candidum]